jgi:hypothetical protein
MKTQYSRRDLYAMGEPLGESVTRMEAGRRVYGGGGGIAGAVGNVAGSVGNVAGSVFPSTAPNQAPNVSPVAQTDQQQGIATYAQPYVNSMLGATMQNVFDIDPSGNITGMKGYTPYSMNAADYVAGFSPLQQQVQNQAAGMQMPGQFQGATEAAQRAIQQAQGSAYGPSDLQQYQMGPAERVRTQSFTQPGAAESYMSPYMQNVVDIQKREAQRASNIAGQAEQAQAVGRGAFGGSRDALMRAERARNLATQMGDIQSTGSQAAFQQAQQQFNADQARRLQAQQANQQAGLTTGQQNLAALLGVQQLGEQSRQFGANYGLQNLQQQLAGAGLLGNLGTSQLAAQQGILGLQNQLGQQQQQQQQNIINQAVQNYQTAQQYPMQQLGQMKSMLQGLPISTSSSQQYQAAPSMVSQLTGLGVAGLGLGNLMGGSGGRSSAGGASSGGSGLSGLLNTGAGLIGNAGSWLNKTFDLGFAEGGEVDSDNAGLAGLGLYNAMNK